MSLKQIPIIGTPVRFRDLMRGLIAPFSRVSCREQFAKRLQESLRSPFCRLTCSGRTAGYLILKALSAMNDRDQVIIPAYVCTSLIGAIKKAGLTARLCDISLDTFQMDVEGLDEAVTDRTLAVIPAHLFGLACDIHAVADIAEKRGAAAIEDFAQSMGTTIDGKETGTIARMGFTSFGRGKNFPTYSGGAVVCSDDELAGSIEGLLEKLEHPTLRERFDIAVKLLLFSVIVNPYVHKAVHPLIMMLKGSDYAIHDLRAQQYTDFQARIGSSMITRFEEFSRKRNANGMYLYERLRDREFIQVPEILKGSRPAFNRFPVLFKETKMRERAEKALLQAGIIACRLYTEPVHRLYPELWDGEAADPFPNASLFAKNSLTLPSHPLVNDSTLEEIVRMFEAL
ncbi:MAG: DegT/DnrJ/EryC1/StrS family aminotransferase [Candidatus Omnitrophota bacterium]